MLDEDRYAALLQVFPVLRDLPEPLAGRLREEGAGVEFPADALLFDLRSPCQGFLMLVDGVVRVSALAENGREILLYRIFPGDSCIVTTSCLIGGSDYPVRGVVDEPVRGVWIGDALFNELLHNCPAVCRFVFRAFAERLTSLLQLVEEVAFHRLDSRLARWLLERGAEIESTHQEIASELGSVREIVSRLLKSFEDQGWVKLGRRRVTVCDTAALREIAR